MTALASEDAWFGTLPRSWRAVPLRFLVRFDSGGTPDKGNREYWDGVIPWVSPKDMKVERIGEAEDHVSDLALRETAISLLPPGAVLLVVRGMILAHSVPVAVTTEPVTINQDMKALRCSERIVPAYLRAVIHGAKTWFLAGAGESSHGTKKLETEVIGRFQVPLPPLHVQRAIADFLDAETSRIDALIAAKENLLALLAEKRRAVITQAVTRGLDPTVPLRDSGVPWLGEIPAHWEVVRLKFLLHGIEQGWSPQCDNSPAEAEEWGVLKSGCVNGAVFREDENKALPYGVAPDESLEVRAGDVLMSRASGSVDLLGACAKVPATVRGKLLISDLLYRLRVRTNRLNHDFLVFIFSSEVGRTQIRRAISSTGGLANKLPQAAVGEFLVPVPPIAEQTSCAARALASLATMQRLESATQDAIRVLRERRDAVITAAVTGQLGVGA